jgi:imidazole glycerol phosphate synthase subunit HisF
MRKTLSAGAENIEVMLLAVEDIRDIYENEHDYGNRKRLASITCKRPQFDCVGAM